MDFTAACEEAVCLPRSARKAVLGIAVELCLLSAATT